MLSNHTRRQLKGTTLEIKLDYLAEVLQEMVTNILEAREKEKEEKSNQTLLTIADLCKKFKISKTTVHNWRDRGIIEGKKVGKNRYFSEDEVKNALGTYGWEKRLVD